MISIQQQEEEDHLEWCSPDHPVVGSQLTCFVDLGGGFVKKELLHLGEPQVQGLSTCWAFCFLAWRQIDRLMTNWGDNQSNANACKTEVNQGIEDKVNNANSVFILIDLLISLGCHSGQGGPGGPSVSGGQDGEGGQVVRWLGDQVVRWSGGNSSQDGQPGRHALRKYMVFMPQIIK